MATLIRMPEVLANSAEAAIQSWLVSLGEVVSVGTPLAEVETEKATVEYAAETEGTVLRLLVAAGEQVAVGAPIAILGVAGENIDDAFADEPDAGSAPTDAAPSVPVIEAAPVAAPVLPAVPAASAVQVAPESDSAASRERLFASPIVRRLAREKNIDLTTLRGSGPDGRIVRRDVDRFEALAPATPTVAEPAVAVAAVPVAVAPAVAVKAVTVASPSGGFDVPHTPMRRAIARRLTESKSTVPHFYVVADCRVDELMALRTSVNAGGTVKISLNDFVLKAAAAAFQEVPEANATWGDSAVRRYDTVDMSVAVGIEGGLLTPVLRSVERMSLSEISRTVTDLAERAKTGKLRQQELEGGSFAVSNLGMYGVTEFSAIINPPQSAILAVGKARAMPVVVDGELAVGTVMTVTLSADHRVLDGVLAAQWLAAFQRRIENPLTILI